MDNLCNKCGGKGFHWKQRKAAIQNENRSTFVAGPRCDACRGTGEAGVLMISRYFAYGVVAMLAGLIIFNLWRW